LRNIRIHSNPLLIPKDHHYWNNKKEKLIDLVNENDVANQPRHSATPFVLTEDDTEQGRRKRHVVTLQKIARGRVIQRLVRFTYIYFFNSILMYHIDNSHLLTNDMTSDQKRNRRKHERTNGNETNVRHGPELPASCRRTNAEIDCNEETRGRRGY